MRRYSDVIEFFAGKARVCRLAEAAGFFSLAHDIGFDDGRERSCMDLNGSAGFVLRGKHFSTDISMAHTISILIKASRPNPV